MKTIITCVLLGALAFWLLPGKQVDEPAAQEGLVLIVEQQPETAQSADAKQAQPAVQILTTEKTDVQEEGEIRLLAGGEVRTISMEEYLTEVLLSEMPISFSMEAKKAQAVAARTFAKKKMQTPKHENADVCEDSACCQAWTSRERLEEKFGADFETVWQSAQDAVRQTAGEVLCCKGQLIDAVYFSCSGGQTEAAVSVWGTDVPYLQSVASPGEEFAPRFSSQVEVPAAKFAEILKGADMALHLQADAAQWLGVCVKTEGGSVARMEIGDSVFSGTELRSLFGLNSAKFTLSYQDGTFVFDVSGFGHRVGLSQYGAENMARLGFSYRTILEYYYQGAVVETEA